jgi:hypothetical protein
MFRHVLSAGVGAAAAVAFVAHVQRGLAFNERQRSPVQSLSAVQLRIVARELTHDSRRRADAEAELSGRHALTEAHKRQMG